MDMHDIDELERDRVYIYNYYLPTYQKQGRGIERHRYAGKGIN